MSELDKRRLDDSELEDVNGGFLLTDLVEKNINIGFGFRRKNKFTTLEEKDRRKGVLTTLESNERQGQPEGSFGTSKL